MSCQIETFQLLQVQPHTNYSNMQMRGRERKEKGDGCKRGRVLCTLLQNLAPEVVRGRLVSSATAVASWCRITQGSHAVGLSCRHIALKLQ